MKDLVVIIGTIILGILILNMMIGDGEDTIKTVSKDVMKKSVLIYQDK